MGEVDAQSELPHDGVLDTAQLREGVSAHHLAVPLASMAIPVVVVALVALMWGSLVLLNTAAAYVGGESQWAKGQKMAVIGLYRASALHVAPNIAEFEHALAVPTADRRARLELEKPDADYALAARAFVDGGNHPSDARAMARLYPMFKKVPVVQRAVTHWQNGDAGLDSLRALAHALVAASGDDGETTALLDRVREVDERLTQDELAFSRALGAATRTLALALGVLIIVLGSALSAGGFVLARRAVRQSAIAAEADRRRVAEFRALAEDAPDAIARLDVDGRHVFANTMLARTTGLDAAELRGRTHDEIADLIGAPPAFADRWRTAIADVLATRDPVAFEVTMPSPTGAREFSVRLAPQLTVDGGVESLIAVARDVTELRAQAIALRDRDEQLQHAQKIEAVGQLAGGIAHDFNNILTAIIGNLELAREELPETHPAHADVEAAIVSSRRATSLTRQLLTFGRRQFLQATRVDLNIMVEETRDMLARLVGERIRLETRLYGGFLPVNADATQLQQVLVNLVVNARDAMPDGGTVVIETHRVRGSAGSLGELTVSDTGHGMSAETRSRVFEPFFTTKPRGQGTGLGLSMAHGIVVQAGGSIELDSTLGEGTSARVYFPLMTETPESVAAVPEIPRTEQRSASILLVEDEAPVRNAVRRMLERSGHHVVEAQHAEDALVQWQRAERSFDVLVTDLMMPGMDGWALLRTLREECPSLSAVVMSGYTGTSDVAERLNDGAVTLTLSKPFGARELMEIVQRALETASPV